MTQNLWYTTKAIFRGRFKAKQACLKTQEKSQKKLTLSLKELENEQQQQQKAQSKRRK